MQDAKDIESVKQMLIDELKKESNAPEFMQEEGDKAFLFTKPFMLKVIRLTQKYISILARLLAKQNEDRRLAAIEENDDTEYSMTFFSKDMTINKSEVEVQDIIFDYFGITDV